MGCDIHMYIEYKTKQGDRWLNFGRKFNPGRNYYLFGTLAGVRGGESTTEIKGIPPDASWTTQSENEIFISDSGSEETVLFKDAERWVSQGISKYTDERKTHVTHPDWHSHTWLTLNEYLLALQDTDDIEYLVVLDAMKSFEKHGYDTRVVFWFDN